MHLWKKQASKPWLERNAAALAIATAGEHAVIERPHRARVLLECCCTTKKKAMKLSAEFGGTIYPLPRNWIRSWESTPAKPLRVGKRLTVITAERQRAELEGMSRVLLIPAGAAFGTGDHATTAMSLRLLGEISRSWPRGWSAFDAGTGTGLLALAARHFGAERVRGIDFDQVAVRTAKENARANKIKSVVFTCADVLTFRDERRYDVITANLFSDLLVRALPGFATQLNPEGRLILSGILRTQEDQVVNALHAADFVPITTRRRGKWIAILASSRRARRQ